MKTLLIIILLLSSKCYGQTTYDRKQDKRIDTLNWAIVKLLSISQQQDEKIRALQDTLSKRVISNKLTFESPLVADSLKNYIKIDVS